MKAYKYFVTYQKIITKIISEKYIKNKNVSQKIITTL